MTIFRNDSFKCLKQYIFINFKNIPVFYCYGALVNPKTNTLSSKSHPIAISFILMRHFIYLFVIFVSSFWKALIKHILNGIFFFDCNIFILDFLKRKLDIRKGGYSGNFEMHFKIQIHSFSYPLDLFLKESLTEGQIVWDYKRHFRRDVRTTLPFYKIYTFYI